MSDTKISALSANTTPVSTDITVIVDDPGGTPQSQKITLANLMALFANPVTDDGDSLGTTSLKWSDVFLALGAVLNFNSGNVTITHSAGVLTIAGGGLVLAAGTNTLAPLKLQAGTNLTTAEDGAIEYDGNCFYGTNDAGNRGVMPAMHYIRTQTPKNLPNDTNENALFDSPANGRLTLEAGVYRVTGLIHITGMSASAGNVAFDLLGAGTATIDSWLWHNWGTDNTTPANATSMTGTFPLTQQSAAGVVNIIGTGTAVAWSVNGTFDVTSAGTMIPSVTQANASAAVVSVGSFLEFWRIGATDVVSVGQFD